MEMVSKADGETTDIFARHLKAGKEQNMYDALHDDLLIYAFGQASAKSRGTVFIAFSNMTEIQVFLIRLSQASGSFRSQWIGLHQYIKPCTKSPKNT